MWKFAQDFGLNEEITVYMYLGESLIQRKALKAPRTMLEQHMIQIMEDIGNQEQPYRVVFNNKFYDVDLQDYVVHELEFKNKVWEE